MLDMPQTVPANNVPGPQLVRWSVSRHGEALGYCCDIRLEPDECGGYTAYVAQLRGVVSQGEDAESAMKNAIEALTGAIESYRAENMPIPWTAPEPLKPGEQVFRIALNV